MPRRDPSRPVNFRLRGALLARLEALAEAEGISRGKLAQRLVTAVLLDEDRLRVLQEVEAVRQEVTRLRSDVAKSLEMILLNAGHATSDEVKAWVSKNLRR